MKKGVKREISRRDFLDGVALVAGGMALSPLTSSANSGQAFSHVVYPPSLTGMRGNHPGSYEVAHALARHGQRPTDFAPVDIIYDLVVVGAGISGLTAAYLYKKRAGPDAKILILDNHDDFGGHAKRNEFSLDGRTLLGVGGSLNLEQGAMGDAALTLLEEIGVDFAGLRQAIDPQYMISDPLAEHGLYLNANDFGADRSINGPWNLTWAGFGDFSTAIQSLELAAADEAGLIALIGAQTDFLKGIPNEEREQFLHETAYATFLSERVGMSESGIKIVEPWIKALFGVSAKSVSISEALKAGAPGATSVTPPAPDTAEAEEVDPDLYRYPIFPDGNASVARLLVSHLVPSAVSGDAAESIVTRVVDYGRLDREGASVRLRLNSTAVNVTNRDDGLVDVAYVVDGKNRVVRCRSSILAGYAGMVPSLCLEVPVEQRQNLAYGVKVPFICTNVLLRSGAAVRKQAVSGYQCPGSFYSLVASAPPVSLGGYEAPTGDDDPLVVWMISAPAPEATGGESARDLCRQGRHRLLSMSFDEIEAATLSQLTGIFGSSGFDAKTDVEAITVNRWAHGYAYEYMDLHDPKWPAGEAPHELARAPIGRISIANSDTEAHAYVQSAIDAAIRAVNEIL
ncbi:NAD(P)-binding protein [Luminiphilus sp.]|nr:NAD(P)-binding protein [Luminiphilus sp.]